MNRILLIFILTLASSVIVYSQAGWVRQYTGFNGSLSSVHFVNENTGYAAGVPILKTTNSGLNWTMLDTNQLVGGGVVFFMDENTGVAGSYNRIYRTTNGGLNWSFSTVSASPIHSIYFINNLTGWTAMGFQFSGYIAKTTNGGINWYNTLISSGMGSVHFANNYIGYALGTYGEVYKSTNGGENWANCHPGTSGSTCIQAVDTNTVYVSHTNGRIRKSIDGGLNWNVQQCSTTTSFSSLYFVNSNTGWAVGGGSFSGKVIAATTNGGASWSLQLSGNSPRIWDVHFINASTGWAVGDSGLVLKTTNGGVVGFSQISNEIPKSFALYQNYPNPFNPVTLIKFDIPSLVRRGAGLPTEASAQVGVVVLKIYDILGREVQTLVNEPLSPGTYEVEFDGTNYPSGVYLYTLKTGVYLKTLKLILLK